MSTAAISYSIGLKNNNFLAGIRGAQTGLKSLATSIGGVTAKLGLMTAALGVGGAVGALALLKKASSAAAEIEVLATSFRVLVGDAKKAATVLKQIRGLAASTPFEFPELATAGKMLIAFGESTQTVLGTLRNIGDVAAGTGASVTELASIYGKARIQGSLFAEDLNQLADKGIPIFEELGKVMGVSGGEVKKLASEGKVTFPMLEKMFSNLTSAGGKYFDMMKEQSGTLKGLLSTLRDNLNDIFITIGQPVNDFLKPILEGGILRLRRLGAGLGAFINLLSAARKKGQLGDFLSASLNLGFKEGINILWSGIKGAVVFLGSTLPGIFDAAIEGLEASKILYVFDLLFAGMSRKFSAAILTALSNLPTLGYLLDVAEFEQKVGSGLVTAARNQAKEIDLGKGFVTAARETQKAIADGRALAKIAQETSSPAFNTADEKDRLRKVGIGVDPKAWQAFEDALSGKLPAAVEEAGSAIVKGTAKIADSMAKAAAAASATAMGLGQVEKAVDGPKTRGLKNAEASYIARMGRRSAADQAKDAERGTSIERAGIDRLGLGDFFRRQQGGSALDGNGFQMPVAIREQMDRVNAAVKGTNIAAPRNAGANLVEAANRQAVASDRLLARIEAHTQATAERLAELGTAG